MLSSDTSSFQQPTINTFIIDFTECGQELTNFLYKIFNYNPAIHPSQLPKIDFYYKLILHHVVLAVNEPYSFISRVYENSILKEIQDPDLLYFQSNADELSMLLLYLLKHIDDHIKVSGDQICILHTYTPTYIIVNIYKLDTEANDLVFRSTGA